MRRITLLVVVAFLLVGNLFGEPVGREKAKEIAARFLDLYASGETALSNEIVAYQLDNGVTAYYFVLLEPTGWVLVSGDDRLKPVIGYSFHNEYVPMREWEEAGKVWFDKVDRHIKTVVEKPGLPVHDGWKGIFDESAKKSLAAKAVEPFIPVTWNQSSGWNRYCPEDEDGPGGHAYVGCVAVSMAQAMSVYQYPTKPMGEHGYNHTKYGYIYVNYDNQNPYDWESMSLTSSDNENARLLYHLAVAVEMGFGPDGSGAYTSKTASVLKNYFGYSESLTYKARSGYDDSEWKQMLIDELLNGRPLIYSGDGDDGEAGHAFNIDGVGADGNYFHVNWGWSGSGNGYFTLDALNPGNFNFSYNQAAVIGIKPPSAGPYDITLNNLTVFDQQPAGTHVSFVEVADEFDDNVYTYKLLGRFNVLLDDYGPANFYIENDTLKTSVMFDAEQTSVEPLTIEVTDSLGNFYREKFEISVEKFYYGPTALTLSDSTVEEGKNPGYFVGAIEIEDDIDNNIYSYSTVGSYVQGNLSEPESFVVRNDSLFTNKTFYKSDGLVYYVEISLTDDHDHVLKKIVNINIVDNKSGTASARDAVLADFSLYPNPVSSYLSIDITESIVGEVQFEMYNILGKKVFSGVFAESAQLDLTGMDKGVYIAVVRSGDHTSTQKLMLK